MRIADIDIHAVRDGMNWRLDRPGGLGPVAGPIAEWGPLSSADDIRATDLIVYSGLLVLNTGAVVPWLHVKEVGSTDTTGAGCWYVNGAWRPIETHETDSRVVAELTARPLETDPAFASPYLRRYHACRFARHRHSLSADIEVRLRPRRAAVARLVARAAAAIPGRRASSVRWVLPTLTAGERRTVADAWTAPRVVVLACGGLLGPDGILELSAEDLRRVISIGEPLVFRHADEELLGELRERDERLVVDLAPMGQGGERVLPAVHSLAHRHAILTGRSKVEWLVGADTVGCSTSNLHRSLAGRGFVVEDVEGAGRVHHLVQAVLGTSARRGRAPAPRPVGDRSKRRGTAASRRSPIRVAPLGTGELMPAVLLGFLGPVPAATDPLWARVAQCRGWSPWLFTVDQQAGGTCMRYLSALGLLMRLAGNAEHALRNPAHLMSGFGCMAEDPQLDVLEREHPLLRPLCSTEGESYGASELGSLHEALRPHFDLPPPIAGFEAFVELETDDPLRHFRDWRIVEATADVDVIDDEDCEVGNVWRDGRRLGPELLTELREIGDRVLPGHPLMTFLLWENCD